MTTQEEMIRALNVRDELVRVIRIPGRRGYAGEKVDVESAQEIAELLITNGYADLDAIVTALKEMEES